MMKTLKLVIVALLSCGLLMSASACAPSEVAVGDSAPARTNPRYRDIHHDSVDNTDTTIGVLGSDSPALDEQVLDLFDYANMQAVYADALSTADPLHAQEEGLEGFIARRVTLVMIPRYPANKAKQHALEQQLMQVRKAGIPVVLLNPLALPEDRRLFAMVLYTDIRPTLPTIAMADAVRAVINDHDHPRQAMVKSMFS